MAELRYLPSITITPLEIKLRDFFVFLYENWGPKEYFLNIRSALYWRGRIQYPKLDIVPEFKIFKYYSDKNFIDKVMK